MKVKMGRKALSINSKSIIRSISLRDEEFEFIKGIGGGSLTHGIREMRELADVALKLNSDFKTAKMKIVAAVDKSKNR
jgi:hypothetical protein